MVLVDTLTTVSEANALADWGEPGQFPTKITLLEPYPDDTFTLEGQPLHIIKQERTNAKYTTSLSPVTEDRSPRYTRSHRVFSKRYLMDFGRMQELMYSDEQLYNEMTRLYPDWVSHQSWLMLSTHNGRTRGWARASRRGWCLK